jgi:hypothetical protein
MLEVKSGSWLFFVPAFAMGFYAFSQWCSPAKRAQRSAQRPTAARAAFDRSVPRRLPSLLAGALRLA